jgi:hypothetical protein
MCLLSSLKSDIVRTVPSFLGIINVSDAHLDDGCHSNAPMLHSHLISFINSLTAKSVPAGTKLVLFGRYVLNIYVGIE